MKLFNIFLFLCIFFPLIETKANLTLDTFLDYTTIVSLSLSSNGENLIIQTRHPLWNSTSFENSLWLYQIVERRKKLITNQLLDNVKYQWSPSEKWILFLIKNESTSNHYYSRYLSKINSNIGKNLYLYSIETDEIKSIPIENDIITAMTWSQNDFSIYYAAINTNSTNDEKWKDVIQYSSDPGSIIRHINIDYINNLSSKSTDIVNIPFLVDELLYSSFNDKLIFKSISTFMVNVDILQIYTIDLKNVTSIIRLTKDSPLKQNLQLTLDKKKLFFQAIPSGSNNGSDILTQQKLYSIDLTNHLIERWTNDFQGNIMDYTIKSNGGVFILGQLGINIQIYSQISPNDKTILHDGFNGIYLLISSSSSNNSIAFVFSSFSKAQEIYFTKDINQLKLAIQLTNENNQYDQMNLPQAKSYQWKSNKDNQTIEGILYYPPGKFQEKNLPLLVLIHGGPGGASLNRFIGTWYNWAPLAATEGWLVLEPNYRGSTGYGDQFSNDIRYQPLTIPGNDILDGIDQLIQDGIVDKNKLNIGGYSYGGILTNWLITQTTRFNAALSGAGSVEHVSFWGLTDNPTYIADLLGGFPWKIPEIYQNQSAIYYLDRIRTPTHIVAGENDVDVPVSQSLILERGLSYLGIPVRLLLLPNEGHPLKNNPWSGKIKLQEEIQWLKSYGLNSTIHL